MTHDITPRSLLRSMCRFVLVVSFLQQGCTNTKTSTRPTRVRPLRMQQPPRLPRMCSGRPKGKRLLLIFASRWCTHCHTLMEQLTRAPKKLRQYSLTPVLMWTDTKHCLGARMAGAHYPRWPFGRPTSLQQQQWGVVATPVIYLVEDKTPTLRIDGAIDISTLFHVIQRTSPR